MSTHEYAAEDPTRHVYACEAGACIAVARQGQYVYIGNTNNPESSVSGFTADEWRRFFAGVKLGHFDEGAFDRDLLVPSQATFAPRDIPRPRPAASEQRCSESVDRHLVLDVVSIHDHG